MPRSLYAQLHGRFGERPHGFTRREMLRRSLAASAALLLSDRLAFAVPGLSGPRVLVIGAGFAGLTAAYELAKAGADVQVFEARNRVGGRVISFHDLVPGGTVEGGAELIGSNHPIWVGYKERFGLAFLDVTEEDAESPIVLNGKRLTAGESEQLWKDMDAALQRLNADAARIDDPFAAWTTAGAAALDARSLADWLQTLDASPLCKAGIDAQMTADNGVRAAWQSYLGNLAMVKGGGLEKYWTDTEVYRCAGGNQQLAVRLARELGADRVHVRTPVSRVDATDRGVRVTTAAGATHDADLVVVAIPPPVWNRIAFTPRLPVTLRPQMGSNVKYLVNLKDPVWRRDHLGPAMLTDGPVQLTWHGTDGQKTASQGFIAFSGGPAADDCRAWTAATRQGNYLSALERVYPGIRASFVRARFMDWPSDPWVKASYSFPAPGEVTTMGPMLQEPLGGRIHFAGEHTCYAFVGYMEGALESGARVARRIMSAATAAAR
ncbi:MAG TPA: NAD(P)/FAD-dependent oxidoreductase [Vicinamibacterales bacterium]|nr:NAD(P)/FAD-dependent oxidoreductase [Vicinamibacterales bacterium]